MLLASLRLVSAVAFLNILVFFPLCCSGVIFTSLDQLETKQYDFIIVGGGTAGNVLANRLSEDPQVHVLVVEAGDTNSGNVDIQIPFLAGGLLGTSVDWNYTTVPQLGYVNRSISYSRGRVLGGSSSINYLIYNRGSDDVWDRWAALTGDSGWSWKSVEKYYLKGRCLDSSRLVPHADGRFTTGFANPLAHGNGPVEVSVPGFPLSIDDVVFATSKALGGRFAFNEDFNGGDFTGVGYTQSIVGQGIRSSAATAYLGPVQNRTNLDILLNTLATRVIDTSVTRNKSPSLRQVELATTANSPRVKITAAKEVILSAGVIGTPHILKLSGIGSRDELACFGIPSVVDLPDVGANLADHPVLANYFQNIGQWQSSKQGLFTDSPANTIAFVRFPADSPALRGVQDPAAEPKSAHAELVFMDGYTQFGPSGPPARGNFVTVLSAVISPTSRGTIKLASTNPFDHPLIDPGFLTTDFDRKAIVQSINDMLTFMNASPWQKDFKPVPWGDLANATTDTQKLSYARNNAVSLAHPMGTARMSSAGEAGVVDSQLRLKGGDGLRVVDASVFPVIPECQLHGLVYIVAERAADLIKNTYHLT